MTKYVKLGAMIMIATNNLKIMLINEDDGDRGVKPVRSEASEAGK